MKKILLLMICVISGFGLYAQTSGGPDLYGYVWKDSNDPNGQAYNWIEIIGDSSTVEISGLTDDNKVGPFFLPGPFAYYWNTVDRFWIGSNGYLSFSANTSHAAPFPIIPTPDTKNNYIAALMSDLNFENTGDNIGNPAKCYYWMSPGMDSAVVTFDSVGFWIDTPVAGTIDYNGVNTFQFILNYIDSTITFQYKNQSGTNSVAGQYLTIGIENISGADGLMPNSNLFQPTNYSLKFIPPVSSTLQINDAATEYVDNIVTGARFISKNVTGAYYLNSQVGNNGNTVLNPFSVSGVVRSSTNALVVSNIATTDTLDPGQTQNLSFANPFIPVNAGTFKFINTTTLAGDAFVGNNGKTQELLVIDTTLAEMTLAYDNGVAAVGGISWSGGNGGCANYFIPPFYPCDITKASIFIVADPMSVGYHIKVFADNGPNNSAGTLLDSVNVAGSSITAGQFTTTLMTAPIRIDSGGFYIAWNMNGNQVALGQDLVAPFSNRNFEILSGTLSDYRSRETEDLMIRSVISRVGVGIEDVDAETGIGQFFPNPARDRAAITIDASVLGQGKIVVQLYDMKGALISNEQMTIQNGQLEINLTNYQTGLYTVLFIANNKEVNRKLQVTK